MGEGPVRAALRRAAALECGGSTPPGLPAERAGRGNAEVGTRKSEREESLFRSSTPRSGFGVRRFLRRFGIPRSGRTGEAPTPPRDAGASSPPSRRWSIGTRFPSLSSLCPLCCLCVRLSSLAPRSHPEPVRLGRTAPRDLRFGGRQPDGLLFPWGSARPRPPALRAGEAEIPRLRFALLGMTPGCALSTAQAVSPPARMPSRPTCSLLVSWLPKRSSVFPAFSVFSAASAASA